VLAVTADLDDVLVVDRQRGVCRGGVGREREAVDEVRVAVGEPVLDTVALRAVCVPQPGRLRCRTGVEVDVARNQDVGLRTERQLAT
jgi:hypothetical protein